MRTTYPKPFHEYFFIIEGAPVTRAALDNIFLDTNTKFGSCLFLHPKEEDEIQQYTFFAVTSYKAPFPKASKKSTSFCDWEYFTDTTTNKYSQSWWLYIEKGTTKESFLFPSKTCSLSQSSQYIEGAYTEIRKRFFTEIVRYYHEYHPQVIPRRVVGVGGLYGQPSIPIPIDESFRQVLNIPFGKALEDHLSPLLSKDIISMLGRGMSMLISAHRWQNPAIGLTTPTMIDIVRGVQWQLLIAYSGFELLFRGMYVLLTHLPDKLQKSINPSILATIKKIPKNDIKGFTDLFFNKMKPILPYLFSQEKYTERTRADFFCFQQDTSSLGAYWEKKNTEGRPYLDINPKQIEAIKRFVHESPKTPQDLISLVTAIRHASTHGMLSPSRIVEWNLFPSLIAMQRGILWMGQEMMTWTDTHIFAQKDVS